MVVAREIFTGDLFQVCRLEFFLNETLLSLIINQLIMPRIAATTPILISSGEWLPSRNFKIKLNRMEDPAVTRKSPDQEKV